MPPIIVWFRQDLRLSDNPALDHAVQSGRPVICLYILDRKFGGSWSPGAASRWWLHKSLESLDDGLRGKGARLILRSGDAGCVLRALVEETGAQAVVWNRCYEPFAVARDTALKDELARTGIDVRNFNSALLYEPWEVKTATGRPYRVFTPYWRTASMAGAPLKPVRAPERIGSFDGCLASEHLASWELLPHAPDWAAGLRAEWTPGERGAQQRLDMLLARGGDYSADRDRPDIEGTSRLSPHLHWGEISPRQVWHAVSAHRGIFNGADKFLSELGWREFSYHLLFFNPHMPDEALDARFRRFPWRKGESDYRAWTRGRTGIPIVDAGMRELWTTGWMHNRVRMIAASFLIKHLGIDWRRGEAWFWDTLADADLANNAQGWQWVAGCGADAAPFFRIFNPVLQGRKFDPEGTYIRRWVPELARLPLKYVHAPWEADPASLAGSGIKLGDNYPLPLVDLAAGRDRALASFRALSGDEIPPATNSM
jgi:deoxyribodipyrimidine photo-lyase